MTFRTVTSGYTALQEAAENGHIKIVRFLLEKGAAVDAVSHKGNAALQWAADRGHLDIIQLLLGNYNK